MRPRKRTTPIVALPSCFALAGAGPAAPSTGGDVRISGSMAAGSTFVKDETTAITWVAGVKIASEIGIDLTARSGYSSTVKNSFVFTKGKNLCGEWAGPGGQSGRLTVAPG